MTLSWACMECQENIQADTSDALAAIVIAHDADKHYSRYLNTRKRPRHAVDMNIEGSVDRHASNRGDGRMTTHGYGIQPGDTVIIDIEGGTISGVVSKISPFRVHVSLNGCKQAVKPDDLAVEMGAEAGL